MVPMYAIYYPDEKCYYVCTVGRRGINEPGTDNFSMDMNDAARWPARDSALAMMRYLNLDDDGCEIVKLHNKQEEK